MKTKCGKCKDILMIGGVVLLSGYTGKLARPWYCGRSEVTERDIRFLIIGKEHVRCGSCINRKRKLVVNPYRRWR